MYSCIFSALVWLYLNHSRWLKILLSSKTYRESKSGVSWQSLILFKSICQGRSYAFARPQWVIALDPERCVWKCSWVLQTPAAHIAMSPRYDIHIVSLVWQCMLPSAKQVSKGDLLWDSTQNSSKDVRLKEISISYLNHSCLKLSVCTHSTGSYQNLSVKQIFWCP